MIAELLICLNVCHWIADFTHASRPWMLAAKKLGRPLLPIAAHAGLHTLLIATVCYLFAGLEGALIAVAIELPTHFGIDVLKGRMNAWIPALQNAASYWHWWVFGADQLLHQVVLIAIASMIAQ